MFFSAECYDLVDLLKGDNPGMSASLVNDEILRKNGTLHEIHATLAGLFTNKNYRRRKKEKS